MKITKIILSTFMSLTILIGLFLAGFSVPVYTNNWALTNVQSNSMSPEVFKGALAVSYPIPVTSIQPNDLLVFGTQTTSPRIGKAIDYEENKNSYLIRAYGSDNKADLISYSSAGTINKVAFSIPLFGYILNLISSPVGAVVFAGVLLLTGVLYIKLFFTKKPKPVVEEEQEINQFIVLKQIFDDTPDRKPTRKERRLVLKEMQQKDKVNV